MKFVDEINNTEHNLDATGSAVGLRATKVELNHEDLVSLLSLDDDSLRDHLNLMIRPRLRTKETIAAICDQKATVKNEPIR